MKTSKLLLLTFCLVFGGGAWVFGQSATKSNLTPDQEKVQLLQQQTLAQQNKTREVAILPNHPTFPTFKESNDMNQSGMNYDAEKRVWVETNRKQYEAIIERSIRGN